FGGGYMKLTYLGTGAAEGVPAVFCNCATCKEVRRRGGREIRTRSQVLIDDTLSIDFPPDAYYHSLRDGADLSGISSLVVTHSHMDHFYAHDFVLRGYKYAQNMTSETLSIFGNEEVGRVFAECTRREMKEDVARRIRFTQVRPYEPFWTEGVRFLPLPARHSRQEQALLYLIEKDGKKVLYLNDTGRLFDEVYPHLEGVQADLVSFDCTFVHQTRGSFYAGAEVRHMGIGDNMAVKAELERVGAVRKDTKYVLTHFSHNQAPLSENLARIEEEYGVIAAYDGMTIEV
ncbi:MAG: MBL fold metallo-hydrolase, partial [Christensenellaceae bacterium]